MRKKSGSSRMVDEVHLHSHCKTAQSRHVPLPVEACAHLAGTLRVFAHGLPQGAIADHAFVCPDLPRHEADAPGETTAGTRQLPSPRARGAD
ncbi:hypothetical protein IFT60_14260 [Massilia sp. CFBP 13721]|nr:hypothetical protein [Massilia sp. CFBP 13721]